MKKQLGLLLAVMMVVNVLSTVSFAASPLDKYNLYDDVMGGGNSSNSDRERATSDFYASSLRPGTGAANGTPQTEEERDQAEDTARQERIKNIDQVLNSVNTGDLIGPRNKDLRDSSLRVYGKMDTPEPWTLEQSFYSKPSFTGIKESYRASNFAGALQECISLVNHKAFNGLTNEQKTIAYYYLAMSYTKCGQKENAIRAYEKVIALNDSPMIVKYATNGRNCVLLSKTAEDAAAAPATGQQNPQDPQGQANEKCYVDVNVPELVYPNAHLGDTLKEADLTPIDPNVLINRNMRKMHNAINPITTPTTEDGKAGETPVNLPFGTQDAELDKFINAPYGNGLSPQFNEEYKQIQLRTIQKKMNRESSSEESSNQTRQDAINLDKKSDLDTMKIAYDTESAYEKLQKDPEYIRQQREIEEISKMFGNSSSKEGDITDLLPYVSEQGEKKLSPEVIQALMMQSMMNDLTL